MYASFKPIFWSFIVSQNLATAPLIAWELLRTNSKTRSTEYPALSTVPPDAAINRMVEIAGEKGLKVTSEEVRGFLKAMDDEKEFDDIELDAIALTAIAGGGRGQDSGC